MQHLRYNFDGIFGEMYKDICDEFGKDIQLCGMIIHIHSFLDMCPHCSAMITREIVSEDGLGKRIRDILESANREAKTTGKEPFCSILVSSQEHMEKPTGLGSKKGEIFYGLVNRRTHGIDTSFLNPKAWDDLSDISHTGRFLQTIISGGMVIRLPNNEYFLSALGFERLVGVIKDPSYIKIIEENFGAIIVPDGKGAKLLPSPHG